MWKSITLHFYGVFLVFDRVLLKLCTWSKTQSIMGHIWYQCWAHVSVERIWRTDILGAWCISPLCFWTLLDLSSSVFALRVEQLIDMNAQWGADGLMLENKAAAVARPWTGCCSLSLLPADLLSSLFLFNEACCLFLECSSTNTELFFFCHSELNDCHRTPPSHQPRGPCSDTLI